MKAIVYLPLDPQKAKEENLPVKLPVLAEDFKRITEENRLTPEVILRGLEAQVETGKMLDYYLSYFVYFLYDRARTSINARDFAEARRNAEKAVSYTRDYRYPFHLGIIERESGNPENSELLLREAVSMKSGFIPARIELARTLIALEEFEDAIEECRRAIETDHSFTLSYVVMGDAYMAIGDFKSATMLYEKALSLDPNLPAVHWRIGVAANALQKFAAAEREFKISISRKEGGWHAKYNLSFALYKRGKLFEAIGLLKSLIDEGIREAPVFTELAILQKMAGLYEEAVETIEDGMESCAGDEGFAVAAMDVYSFAGMPEKALELARDLEGEAVDARKRLIDLQDGWDEEMDLADLAELLNTENRELVKRLKGVADGEILGEHKEVFDESLIGAVAAVISFHGLHPYSAEGTLTRAAIAYSGSIDTVALFIYLYRLYLYVNAFGYDPEEAVDAVTASIADISRKVGRAVVKVIEDESDDLEELACKKDKGQDDVAAFFTSSLKHLGNQDNPVEFLRSYGVNERDLDVFGAILGLNS